ncbi:ABC transporter substrate-binding protein [Bradyrhizobium viridifuturi]|jgi:branched-chain amino acid transport system substrate-binding protein|nr:MULTISPECIES: ABC transporter substrate-binding protein [Bradyrhizobium]ERF79649.1 MAG: aliphatic nitrilase [Bradyrhizobium sp. DFCI-1]OYU59463.1 MAG: branched-chain amino acid ABC transporter substrate-binding protein [Bradyrhizobium sp. PARBB1]PSO19877.1 branched-chain amino acid ABC transporter substrate-binding protein [Bradyrhizobium sp. MOS004]QRI70317.1 ABC transporter substrate-binding protein [Bradyrhizobium sp. PSBB068]MBR1022436.1 ABC transporter substrate-binding protein [Bradyr
MSATRHLAAFAVAFALVSASGSTALAQKNYDTGATDTEIKIGNIMPYSGAASAYGVIGKTEDAYFRKINAEGGINGRKITFISYDDAYTPPKTVEQARKLVESDEVLMIFNSLGTPPNSAIQKYMNQKKVPQLFVATGATKWNDPKEYPWTMGWQPNYQSESIIYAKYILKNKPDARIAVLYQNDDYGKDYLKGFKDGLGAKAASMIVAEDSYEVTEPTIDSHIVRLKASGADVFFNITTPKFAAQAIKKNAELDWHPLHFLNNVSSSIGSVIKPAGFEAAQGIVSSQYLKDPTDPQWKTDKGMIAWNQFLDKYYPEANRADASVMYAYTVAQGLEHVLRACGDNLTRQNIMKQAANLRDLELDGLLPGIKVNTSATDFAPLSQLQLMRFKGETWDRFGEILSGDVGG